MGWLWTTLLTAAWGAGGRIDFEQIPGVAEPYEGIRIGAQFQATHGVRFALEGGGEPVLAAVGPPQTAFAGPPSHRSPDTPLPDQDIGRFFLTDDGVTSGISAPALIVHLDRPTHAASGVLLDIDFDEVFVIELRDDQGALLEEIRIQAGDPSTGDGVATPWAFQRPAADVASLWFRGSRQAAGYFGLGFDNFFPGEAEPLAAARPR